MASRPLTKRQHQVVNAVASGKSDRQVARALKISIHTARHHLQDAYDRMGIHGRLSLALAVRNGKAGPNVGRRSSPPLRVSHVARTPIPIVQAGHADQAGHSGQANTKTPAPLTVSLTTYALLCQIASRRRSSPSRVLASIVRHYAQPHDDGITDQTPIPRTNSS